MSTAEIVTLAYFVSVGAVSIAIRWLVRRYAPVAGAQGDQIANAGLTTAMLGGVALWLFFTLAGVAAAG